jgi:hypothetical protein
MTIARPDITTKLPKRNLSQLYTRQRVSGETFPIMKEAQLQLTLGTIITEIKDESIQALNVLHAYNASVGLGCHML